MSPSIPEDLAAKLDEIETVDPDRANHLRGEYARAQRWGGWQGREALRSVAQEIHEAHRETARLRARVVAR